MPVELTTLEGPDGWLEHDAAGRAGARVRRTRLPGGVRVLTEQVPGARSATLGAWVGVGSRDEADHERGSTHFLEHLLFKGTRRRSAMDIAVALDEVGGDANAATGKETTSYYARVLDADLPVAVDVVCDMVTSAVLRPEDVDGERGVILEELAAAEDDDEDVAQERFALAVHGDTPLGRPIGGTPDDIRRATRDAVADHYRRHYVPEGLVVTAAGGLEHDAVCDLVSGALAEAGWPVGDAPDPLPRRAATAGEPVPSRRGPGGVVTVERDTEQAHVLLGGPGLTATDERRWVMGVLVAVLGGGMSSRLFQEVREKRGLAYSTYAFDAGYADDGLFGLYAGCTPARVPVVVELLAEQWALLARDGLGEDELRRGRGQLSGSLVLGMEDSGARMTRLARTELVHGRWTGVDEALGRIAAVTADDVVALAGELLDAPRSLVVVGPFDDDPVAVAP
ncbi:pitrilysin family protein [uncultured Pseudokineococcus sp.]|uniref:M16 family metallopeptidase n=1 Tax=uncultured Pseudokineococcus sp. TaxID=1642928 RepID=UPI002617C415|nr:pitrilysin family protein [uncultured Pseudokineococcus sp.]